MNLNGATSCEHIRIDYGELSPVSAHMTERLAMGLMRIVLLLVMLGLVFVMAEFPAVYAPRKTKTLVETYDGKQDDTAVRRRQVASKTVQREIYAIEVLFGAVFLGSLVLFVRAGRRLQRDPSCLSSSSNGR